MGPRDSLSFLALLLLAIVICVSTAYSYKIGGFSSPGPGFFPLVLGITLGTISLVGLVTSAYRGQGRYDRNNDGFQIENWWRVVYALCVLLLSAFILELAGFLLTAFVLFMLLMILNYRKWYVVLGGALVASVGTYAIFRLALKVEVPRGILGI